MHRILIIAALILTAALPHTRAAAQDVPAIAAASDLKFALEEVAAKFKADTGREVKLVFGSSGNFTQQILNGAPFQMLMSADEAYIFKVADAGKTLAADRGKLYAVGRIGIFVPRNSPLRADAALDDLAAALKDRRIKRFAIANPEHAPYGRAAQQALQRRGLWEALQPLLILGENVSQAAQFAASGSAEGGIIPLSLARAPAVGGLGTFALLPAEWHDPLRQRMVLLLNAGETAKAFYAYISEPPAREIFIKYGFLLPGEG